MIANSFCVYICGGGCVCVCVCDSCVLKILSPTKLITFPIFDGFWYLGKRILMEGHTYDPTKKGVKGHLWIIWGHYPQMVKICTIGHCILILWWIFMGLGQKNIVVRACTPVTPTTSWTQWLIASFGRDIFCTLHNPEFALLSVYFDDSCTGRFGENGCSTLDKRATL